MAYSGTLAMASVHKSLSAIKEPRHYMAENLKLILVAFLFVKWPVCVKLFATPISQLSRAACSPGRLQPHEAEAKLLAASFVSPRLSLFFLFFFSV